MREKSKKVIHSTLFVLINKLKVTKNKGSENGMTSVWTMVMTTTEATLTTCSLPW